MKIPFDLQYYLDHPDVNVVTGGGRKARILCTDIKGTDYQMMVLLEDDNEETCSTYTIEGHYFNNKESFEDDLFFDLPEPKKKKVPLTYEDLPEPKKKKVPLTYEDLLERIKAGKIMWIKTTVGLYLVKFIDVRGYMFCGNILIDPEILLDEEFRFADGDPCWKEVEDVE